MQRITLSILAILLLAGGLAWVWLVDAPETVSIDQARIRLLPGDGPQAGYFVLQNNTRQAVRLQSADSPLFNRIMLHQTRIRDGQSQMDHLQGVEITAGDSIEFAPGGMHLMMVGANQPLEIGDLVPVTLEFSDKDNQARQLTFEFIVVPITP